MPQETGDSSSTPQPCEVHQFRPHFDPSFCWACGGFLDVCTILVQIRPTYRLRPEHPRTFWLHQRRFSILNDWVFRSLYLWSCCPLDAVISKLGQDPHLAAQVQVPMPSNHLHPSARASQPSSVPASFIGAMSSTLYLVATSTEDHGVILTHQQPRIQFTSEEHRWGLCRPAAHPWAV